MEAWLRVVLISRQLCAAAGPSHGEKGLQVGEPNRPATGAQRRPNDLLIMLSRCLFVNAILPGIHPSIYQSMDACIYSKQEGRSRKKTTAPMLLCTHTDDASEAPPNPRLLRNSGQLCCTSASMAYSCCRPIIASFVSFLLVSCSAYATGNNGSTTALRLVEEEQLRFQRMKAQLARVRETSVKTIQSPDGDVIDCVPSHLQPAFDHPKLRGQKPEDEPEARPGNADDAVADDDEVLPQMWRSSGEWCPKGTIPVRRTMEGDLLRASSVRRFGMKPQGAAARRDTTSNRHEHAVGYVSGGQFYGAKASLNVWPAQVSSPAEFSLSQIWVISGSFGNDLNTIEAGWQVSPELYGDNSPRFFTYWTNDAYQETGCYNLHCAGFVQTNGRVVIGAAITPVSAYGGRQFDITLMIWKDPKKGNWWLQLGPSGTLVGYWPSSLFTHLGARGRGGADMVQLGGEAVNTRPSGSHTPTQMGSGRFPGEGYGRAAYFRNVQVVDWDNNLIPAAGLRLLADHPGCYDIAGGQGGAWGSYFYYGGPGRNIRCP